MMKMGLSSLALFANACAPSRRYWAGYTGWGVFLLGWLVPSFLFAQNEVSRYAKVIDSLILSEQFHLAQEETSKWQTHLQSYPDRAEEALLWSKRGKIYNSAGGNQVTDSFHLRAIQIIEENGLQNTLQYAEIQVDFALTLFSMGKSEDAEQTAYKGFLLTQQLLGGSHIRTLANKNTWAFHLIKTAKLEQAETVLKEVMDELKKQHADETTVFAYSLNEYADCLNQLGDFNSAWNAYRECLALKKKLYGDQSKKYWETLFDYCVSLITANNFEEALPLLEEEKALNQRLFGHTKSPNRMSSIQLQGAAFMNLKSYEESIATYEDGKKVAIETSGKNSRFYAVCCYYIGLANDGLKQHAQADSAFNEAIQIMQNLNVSPKNLHFNLFKLGKAQSLARWKQYDAASDILNEITPFFEDKKNTIYYYYIIQAQADIAFGQGEFEKGIKFCDDVITNSMEQYGPTSDLATTFLDKKMNAYYDNGYYKEANNTLEAYAQIIKVIFFYNFPLLSDFKRYEFLQEYSTAIGMQANSMIIMPELDLAGSLLNKQLIAKNALESSTKRMQQQLKSSSDAEVQALYNEWETRYTDLADYYQLPPGQLEKDSISLPEEERKVQVLEGKLAQKGIQVLKQQQPVVWTDIKSALQFDEAAIDILRFKLDVPDNEEAYGYAFLIVRPEWSKPEVVFYQNGNQLESAIAGQHLAEIASQKDVSLTFYEQCWKSLAPHLKGVRTLYLSPDGIFHKINLATLRLPDNRYMIEDMDVRTVTGLRHILDRGAGIIPQQGGKMAIVGNPDFGLDLAHNTAPVESTFRDLLEDAGPDLQLVPLPASEREAKFIAEKAKGAHWSLLQLLGKAATETAVKQIRQPDVLHLATHGYFMKDRRGKEIANLAQYSKRNPALRSMLFFAGAQNTLNGQQPAASDDGILTAFEAALIPLEGTELVVLSACNTGLGKIQNGEGVIGLQRAFRVAGARSLVMTLWEVEDSATEIFMNVFYEGLFAGKTKTAAFRAAQQALKAKFPQPFYWGAFVLVNG